MEGDICKSLQERFPTPCSPALARRGAADPNAPSGASTAAPHFMIAKMRLKIAKMMPKIAQMRLKMANSTHVYRYMFVHLSLYIYIYICMVHCFFIVC